MWNEELQIMPKMIEIYPYHVSTNILACHACSCTTSTVPIIPLRPDNGTHTSSPQSHSTILRYQGGGWGVGHLVPSSLQPVPVQKSQPVPAYPRYSGPTTLASYASCGDRAVNVKISVGSSQLFWDEAFVVLRDPVPSTNYHNGNNNMQSIV